MLDKLKAVIQLTSLIQWIKDRCQPYYLLHVQIGDTHANTVLAGSVVAFIVARRRDGLIVAGSWRISRKEYLLAKAVEQPLKKG